MGFLVPNGFSLLLYNGLDPGSLPYCKCHKDQDHVSFLFLFVDHLLPSSCLPPLPFPQRSAHHSGNTADVG